MTGLPRALALAFAQLGDPAILRVLAKSLAVTLAIFGGLGALLWMVLAPRIDDFAARYAFLAEAVVLVLAIVSAWLLFRFVALAVIQFFADDVVRAVERRHYPEAAAVPNAGFANELAASARGLARALAVNAVALPFALLLLVTGVGTAILFWIVNAVLLGRELTEIVWLRHRAPADGALPVGGATRFALGGIVAALLAVPVVNLIAPVLGAAAATHLVHGRRARDA